VGGVKAGEDAPDDGAPDGGVKGDGIAETGVVDDGVKVAGDIEEPALPPKGGCIPGDG
jgi:hypothetical protein